MLSRKLFLLVLIAAFSSTCRTTLADEISVEGRPADSGFNLKPYGTLHGWRPRA
jgi:hypothetical protein